MKLCQEKTENDSVGQHPTELHAEVRTALAKQFIAWKARGWKKEDFLVFLSEAGFDIPMRTLTRWCSNVKQQGTAVTQNYGGNRERILSEEETQVVSGFVLDKFSRKEEVHLDTIQSFIYDCFNTEISLSTVHRYLEEQGFSSRVAKGRTGGVQLDLAQMVQIAHEWLTTSPIHCLRYPLCSVDFTYTSHRTDRRVSYSLKGGPQPQVDQSFSRFTNCILTCVWADGIDRTPPVLFTYNQEFRSDRPPTERRHGQLAHLSHCLHHFQIGAERVMYVGRESGESRCYVQESSSLVQKFFGLYTLPRRCTVLSDNGNAFLDSGDDVLLKIGFFDHLQYPSIVHHFLSPNDNRLHGAAKKKWREMKLDYTDDVMTSIALLRCLDDSNGNVGSYFERNMQLGSKKPRLDQVHDLIEGQDILDSQYFQRCLELFHEKTSPSDTHPGN